MQSGLKLKQPLKNSFTLFLIVGVEFVFLVNLACNGLDFLYAGFTSHLMFLKHIVGKEKHVFFYFLPNQSFMYFLLIINSFYYSPSFICSLYVNDLE